MKTTKNDLLERLDIFLTKYENFYLSEWTKELMDIDIKEFVNSYISEIFETFVENSFYVDFKVITDSNNRIKKVKTVKINLDEIV